MLLPVTAHAARNLTGLSLDRPVEDYHWQKDGSIVLLAANGFSNLLVTYTADGARHDLAPTPAPAGSMGRGGGGGGGGCLAGGTGAPGGWGVGAEEEPAPQG